MSSTIRDKLWQRERVTEGNLFLQPEFVGVRGATVETPPEDLGAYLLARPGVYILKPRFGSNGMAVVRIESDGTVLRVASDCPDTACYIDEYPTHLSQRGQDVVRSLATERLRYLNRATVGIPEQLVALSILEREIPADRVGCELFEPRVIFQRRTKDKFELLGEISKVIATPISAVVARDFEEISFQEALTRFLERRVPAEQKSGQVDEFHTRLMRDCERAGETVTPLIGAETHQFGVDGRLTWNAEKRRCEFWFLEFQFGIGRVTPGLLTGYRTPAELRRIFDATT